MIRVAAAGAASVVVTFEVPACAAREGISVVGDFNGWSAAATPMAAGEQGFVARVALPVGRTYRFRYLVDQHRWENDWAADGYVANELGGDDSLIDLTSSGPRGQRAMSASRTDETARGGGG